MSPKVTASAPPFEETVIGDLISEAMEDNESAKVKTAIVNEEEDDTLQRSVEEALTRVIFESDDEENGQFQKHKIPHGKSPMMATRAVDDDEDDFCILVAPTTAKVVSCVACSCEHVVVF